jgi:tRNA-dihydrouridine synthase B
MTPDFNISDIPIYGKLILAPMDGFSDVPYRSLCRQYGSAISYTAFVNAIDIEGGSPHIIQELEYLPEERPVIFQIFDSSEDRLLAAALKIQKLKPDAIDINMGCSVRRVSGRGAGAGLLKDPGKIANIMQSLSRHLDVPTTAKIRLGWDDSSLNYLDIAKAIEDNGGALIAVHARTRAQGYGGKADWDAIAAIKQHVRIPVIGNGDIRTTSDIDEMLVHTNCDAVMIGRAAIGNPWIFRKQSLSDITMDEFKSVVFDHLDKMIAYYGLERAVVLFRKHLAGYIRPLNPSVTLRQSLLRCHDLEQIRIFMDLIIERYLAASGLAYQHLNA